MVDDQQIPSEATLNALLKRRIRQDPPELGSRPLFTSPELVKLDHLVATSRRGACCVPKDPAAIMLNPADCLARSLAEDVLPYMIGGKRGLDDSLRSRLGLMWHEVGCCSDYNEAFLLRARATGLQAREAHYMVFTTADYFDPASQSWR